jgi:hypothetical protein
VIVQQVEQDASMLRNLSGLIALTALLLSATASFAVPVHGKAHPAQRWHGYGFLPGYRSPERIERGRGKASRARLLVWRPGLLSRALERRRVRPLLDPNPDRQCEELRPIAERDQTSTGRRSAWRK